MFVVQLALWRTFCKFCRSVLMDIFLVAVLKGISDGMSRGKKPEEMDNLVNKILYLTILICRLSLMLDKKK